MCASPVTENYRCRTTRVGRHHDRLYVHLLNCQHTIFPSYYYLLYITAPPCHLPHPITHPYACPCRACRRWRRERTAAAAVGTDPDRPVLWLYGTLQRAGGIRQRRWSDSSLTLSALCISCVLTRNLGLCIHLGRDDWCELPTNEACVPCRLHAIRALHFSISLPLLSCCMVQTNIMFVIYLIIQSHPLLRKCSLEWPAYTAIRLRLSCRFVQDEILQHS